MARPPGARVHRVKNLARSLCAAAALVALAAPAPAAELPAASIAEAVALARQAGADLAPPNARIEVVAGELDPRLRLAPCERIQVYLPETSRPWGRSRIGLRCVQGTSPWNVFLPVTVRAFSNALVATRAIAAGTVVDESMLRSAEVDWAELPAAPSTQMNDWVGRKLARPLAAGQALRTGDTQPRMFFAAGDTVRVVIVGNGFSVSSEGQALTNGYEGQQARVRTDGNRVISGTPNSDHRMAVVL